MMYRGTPYIPGDLGTCFGEIVKQWNRANAAEDRANNLERTLSDQCDLSRRLSRIEGILTKRPTPRAFPASRGPRFRKRH